MDEDTGLIVLIAAVWLAVAGVYHAVDIIEMPEGERIWTISAGLSLALMTWVLLAERKGRGSADQRA